VLRLVVGRLVVGKLAASGVCARASALTRGGVGVFNRWKRPRERERLWCETARNETRRVREGLGRRRH